MFFNVFFILLSVFLKFIISRNAPFLDSKADLVTSLPGIEFNSNYDHYSGFLNSINNTRLHYWFFESSNSLQNNPIILWLNGGPGCSSMIGALTEIGPIRLNIDGTIKSNIYSWNAKANILFLETPIGVGFSYSTNHKSTAILNDDLTAEMNLEALKSFFIKFPQLINNDFYIAGESYAGVFVPMLARLVINHHLPLNFKGIAIGNGYLSHKTLQNSRLHYLYHHGLMSVDQWQHLTESCCPSISASKLRSCDFYSSDSTNDCSTIRSKFQALPLDPYNIYDLDSSTNINLLKYQRGKLDYAVLKKFRTNAEFNEIETEKIFENREYISEYLNQNTIRRALHVETSPNVWRSCQNFDQHYKKQYPDMSDHIRFLLSSNIRVVIYNGDLDTVCNFLGVQWFVRDLGLRAISEFEPWFYNNFIFGGMTQKFQQGLTFLTVLGAGHMVPSDKPEAALNMLVRFILETES